MGGLACVCIVTAFMLIAIGAVGAHLGGASHAKGALRVLVGGSVAMGVTYGIGAAFAAIAGPAFPGVA